MSDERDFDPPLRVEAAGGAPITGLDDWRRLAAPAGGDAQWRVGRSACEIANAWTGTGTPRMPSDFAQLLESTPDTATFTPGLARPEAKIALDAFRGNTRNADLLLHGRSGEHKALVTVEAKADEAFGRYVADELSRVEAKPTSKLPDRIAALSELLFGPDPDVSGLRYQLIHGLAATVLEATRRTADLAIFVVHEFRTDLTTDAKHEANHQDLRYFMARFAAEYVVPGRLQRVDVAGARGMPVFVGLVTTNVRERE